MRHQSEKGRRSNDDGKSEGCIVPMKPGNSGGGEGGQAMEAIEPEHPLGHSAGIGMFHSTRLQNDLTCQFGIAIVGSRMR